MPDTPPCNDLVKRHEEAARELDEALEASMDAKDEWDKEFADTEEAAVAGSGLSAGTSALLCWSQFLGWVICGTGIVVGYSIYSSLYSLNRIAIADAERRFHQAETAYWKANARFSRESVSLAKCLTCEMIKLQRELDE
jgi:hypothetical protein